MVYNSVETKLVEPFSGGGEERPDYIAVREGIRTLTSVQ